MPLDDRRHYELPSSATLIEGRARRRYWQANSATVLLELFILSIQAFVVGTTRLTDLFTENHARCDFRCARGGDFIGVDPWRFVAPIPTVSRSSLRW
ncbi:hypothetical protein [Paraburkholderia phenoliruptrix]|uniref:hypothetical protein n=1 Tax=Paraburkholderia phenoliruptrix TaxID=252970 RepID=UPI00055584B4|nr:hypothetical protein [Paraburkholderia phenoliruptrix]